MNDRICILWFRQDLRLSDNPALSSAIKQYRYILPLYIFSSNESETFSIGAASRWWLHESLKSLEKSLNKKGSKLILRQGNPLSVLKDIIKETGASAVFTNRCYEPDNLNRDKKISDDLTKHGIDAQSFNGSLLLEPWEVKTQVGKPYQVYTAFWKATHQCSIRLLLEAPQKLASLKKYPTSVTLESLNLKPKINWFGDIEKSWTPGEEAAKKQLEYFIENKVTNYSQARDCPFDSGTSRLSPHLHFGEIGPCQIWHALEKTRGGPLSQSSNGKTVFLKEIFWREFAFHLMFHFPDTVLKPLRNAFLAFPWIDDQKLFDSWKNGKTGYPLVDAGMRELWHTGWMHNRVRMVVASFLTKDLLLNWTCGAKWFWDTLVDADLANNTFGWQWAAGCGADAAPFFRIFNPVLQGEKFDPDGQYVRKWVPELRELPNRWIHRPWLAPQSVLMSAKIRLGRDYPFPIVDHAKARQKALVAYKLISARKKG